MEITKELLMHWLKHFAKTPYTADEEKEFEKIIDEYGEEKIIDIMIVTFAIYNNFYPTLLLYFYPTLLLYNMRQGQIKEIIEQLPDHSAFDEEEEELYKVLRDHIISTLSHSISKKG